MIRPSRGLSSHDPPGRYRFARVERGFFFVLFSSFRFFINVSLLERPLIIGLFWAAIYGDMDTTLKLCLFYELFWLDGIPAGTHIPPNAAASTLVGLSLMHVFGLSSPGEALLVASTTALLARLFSGLEGAQRLVENIMFSRYLSAVDQKGLPFRPGWLIMRAGRNMVLLNGVAIIVSLGVMIALFSLLLPRVWPYLSTSRATWSQLWLLGSLGGILSLRYRPAYVVLAVGAAIAALWPLWHGFFLS